jgi:Mid2 like cell wall stress sensor
MRVVLSAILAVVLTIQTAAQQPAVNSSVQQEISTVPANSLVQVNLKDGQRLRGHIVSRTDSDFSLQREKGGGKQSIAYDQVLSVSQVKAGHSHKKKWIIIGVVTGVGVAAVVVALVILYGLSHPG